MSLYNIDENKNMVLDALFAPYSDSPRDVTNTSSTNSISLDVLDWIDVFADFSNLSENTDNIECYMEYAGVYMVIKHHYGGDNNGYKSDNTISATFLSTIYIGSTTVSNRFKLTAVAYNLSGVGENTWLFHRIGYFRIIRLQ